MHSSAAQHRRQGNRPARGGAHLWVPRGLGDAAMLLALVLDRPAGHPDNCSATGRTLGQHRDTVRRHRAELLRLGLAVVERGFLVGTDVARALRQQGCDPLPRAILRGAGGRPTTAMMRAAAIVYADAVGWRAGRHGCRSDSERAGLAGVARKTVVAARMMLVERGLVTVEELRRGRAGLRRARLTADRVATHGCPMSEARSVRLADLARRGRSRPHGGAVPGDSEGAVRGDTPMQSPLGTVPMQAPPAPPSGFQIAALRDGWAPRRGSTAPAADLVGVAVAAMLPPNLQHHLRDEAGAERAEAEAGERAAAHDAACAELRRLAGDRGAVARLLALPDDRGCAQLLALLRVDDRAPRRRAGRAVHVGRLVGTAKLLAIAADTLLGRPRNLAAVLLQRVQRVADGESPQTRCRRDWSLRALLEAVAGAGVTSTGRVMAAGDHKPHRQLAVAAATEAAQRGDWRRVDELVQRHRLELQVVADRAGVDGREIAQQLSTLAERRRTAFAAGRATA